MGYSNFKPTIWSKHIQHELHKTLVFKADCDYKYQGEVGKGKKVKILGVGKPTVGDYTGEKIGAPETVADSSVYLEITEAKFFNFQVDDVDKAQATEGLMAALMEEATNAMAEQEDAFCAKDMALNCSASSASAKIDTKTKAKEAVDKAFTILWGKGVKFNDKVTMYITPWFYNLFKDYLIETKTDNDQLIAKGIIGTYNNAKVKMTNNVYNDGTDDYMIIKTSKAYAFATGIQDTEAYRPEELFSDAVKGLCTYGGKMVRPKEAYCIKARA